MRLPLFIVLTSISLLFLGQTEACDTLYLNNGKKIPAQIHKENRFSFSYLLCCEGCSEIRKTEKKYIQKIVHSDSIITQFDHTIPPNSPVLIGIEAGGAGFIGGPYVELSPIPRFGVRFGVGYFYPYAFPLHTSIFFKIGQKVKFVPSIGFSKFVFMNGSVASNITAVNNFYGIQANTKFGYIRFSPGIIFTMTTAKVKDTTPFVGLSFGFNLTKNKLDSAMD